MMTSTATASVESSEEHRELRNTVARLLSREADRDATRNVMETSGYVEALWKGIGDLGLTGILVPERYGGAEGTLGDAVVVLEELGRVPTALPFFASSVLTTTTISALGDDRQRSRWLPDVAEGALVGTVAACAPDGSIDAKTLGVTAHRDGDLWRLRGSAVFVPDAGRADLVVLACRADDGVLFAVVDRDSPGVAINDSPCFDMSRRFADVEVFDIPVEPAAVLGDPVRGARFIEQLAALTSLAIAADSLGGLQRVTELSAAYATDRVQFGKPIGSFQAIKHLCADMAIGAATSRVAVDNAVRNNVVEPIAASIAKTYVSQRYAKSAGDCVQVHGGIGFTWEHDAHIFLRRAKLNEALYGDARWHRERIAQYALHRQSMRPPERIRDDD